MRRPLDRRGTAAPRTPGAGTRDEPRHQAGLPQRALPRGRASTRSSSASRSRRSATTSAAACATAAGCARCRSAARSAGSSAPDELDLPLLDRGAAGPAGVAGPRRPGRDRRRPDRPASVLAAPLGASPPRELRGLRPVPASARRPAASELARRAIGDQRRGSTSWARRASRAWLGSRRRWEHRRVCARSGPRGLLRRSAA